MYDHDNNEQIVQERNVWADDVDEQLFIISEQIRALEKKQREIRNTCNHVTKDGKSTLQRYYVGEDEGFRTFCNVCKC